MTEAERTLLAEHGWSVDCLSPLEISHEDGSVATGKAVHYVVAALVKCQVTTQHQFQPPYEG